MTSTSGQSHHPPATPVYILRGHTAPIHALHVFAQNVRLVSGDADGWVVIWDLLTKRPVTVWKAHAGAVLEVKGFITGPGITEIYTHGRDHKLCVWKMRAEDEPFLDKTLPVDLAQSSKPDSKTQPWLLHSLSVNALNFCAFSMAFMKPSRVDLAESPQEEPSATRQDVLFAVPNALDSGGIDIFHLPSERRLTTIKSQSSVKTGMLMAVSILISQTGDVFVASAFEDGHVMVFMHPGPLTPASFELAHINSSPWKWVQLYGSQPHTQPVLSLDVSPSQGYFISSSADALLVKHPIPAAAPAPGVVQAGNVIEDKALKTVNTKHSGQQGLRIRSDGKVFATAGWDSRVRVYSAKTMKELAVLKWHKEGCYAVAFGEVIPPFSQSAFPTVNAESSSGESALANPSQTEGPTRSIAAVHRQRLQKIQQTHWLVAGSKDGKISLWDIY